MLNVDALERDWDHTKGSVREMSSPRSQATASIVERLTAVFLVPIKNRPYRSAVAVRWGSTAKTVSPSQIQYSSRLSTLCDAHSLEYREEVKVYVPQPLLYCLSGNVPIEDGTFIDEGRLALDTT